MANKFSSPGVTSTEIDQSFTSAGVAGIGGVFIGRSRKGPAFLPTFLQEPNEVVLRFGEQLDSSLQAIYGIKKYLANSSAATFVRVLGHDDGSTTTNGYTVSISALTDSGSNGKVLAVIHHSGTAGSNVTATQVVGDNQNFVFKVGSIFAATASFVTSSANYITKVLNTDPTKFSTYGHYIYKNYTYSLPQAAMTASLVAVSGGLSSFQKNYDHSVTAWVKSQPLGGLDFDLFRFHTLADGKASTDEVKVLISNVRPSVSPSATPYGTFDVVVRSFYDTDQRPLILETFVGCTLDPSQKSYVARRIGDKWEQFDTAQRKFVVQTGVYPQQSKYIRIETNANANFPAEALPWGHRGYGKLAFVSGSTVQDMPLTISQYDRNGNLDPNISFGISFVSGGIDDRMQAQPVGAVGGLTGSDADFSLGFLSASFVSGKQVWYYNTAIPNTSFHQPVYASASMYRFNLPFAGGFDGWDLRVYDPLYLNNSDDESTIGVVSAKRALDCIGNPDAQDMNLLFTNGIDNLKVCDKARAIVNDRKDVMYVMDITGSTVQEAIGNLKNRDIDDNYTATYYPDVRITDDINNKIVRVKPSVAMAAVFAFSDKVGQVFFAPAGVNRGGLGIHGVVDVVDRLLAQDRDDLYNNRINPIGTFTDIGITVFGQKTLQVKQSALDRVNVRRLLIYAKKAIKTVAYFLLFESNNAPTWQGFINGVNPILEDIRQKNGLTAFKVVMDSSTNPSSLIDQNIMTGKIFLVPVRTAEFIDISFIISSSGVSFAA